MKSKEIMEKKDRFKRIIFGYVGYSLLLVSSIFYVFHLDKTVPAPNLFVGFFALMTIVTIIVYIPLTGHFLYQTYLHLFASEGKGEKNEN